MMRATQTGLRLRRPHAGHDAVSKDIERVQTDICNLGVTSLALQYMTAHEDALVQSSLRLLVALLDGGNRVAQHSLLTILHKSKDGRVFLRLREKMVRTPRLPW